MERTAKIFLIALTSMLCISCVEQVQISPFEMMKVRTVADAADNQAEQADASAKRAAEVNQELEKVVSEIKIITDNSQQCHNQCRVKLGKDRNP